MTELVGRRAKLMLEDRVGNHSLVGDVTTKSEFVDQARLENGRQAELARHGTEQTRRAVKSIAI